MLIAKHKISPTEFFCIALSALMLALTASGISVFEALNLYATKIQEGEVWRLLTANMVHFGWAHTLMNLAAFLLCCYAFFDRYPIQQFIFLLLISFLSVGLGIFFLNPLYTPYAGLSGAIHGLVAAGILLTREYPVWLRWSAGILLAGKLAHENSGYFEATGLQKIIGTQIATESHLYGALGGLTYTLLVACVKKLRAPKH
jgi:rhomboid family GlyGly-CTERM serine protease